MDPTPGCHCLVMNTLLLQLTKEGPERMWDVSWHGKMGSRDGTWANFTATTI